MANLEEKPYMIEIDKKLIPYSFDIILSGQKKNRVNQLNILI